MNIIALTVLRYLFLVAFYIFIFYVIKTMVLETKRKKKVSKVGRHKPYGGQLTVITDTDKLLDPGRCFDLATALSIGRDSSNDIQIKKDFVSKKHARIFYQDNRYWVEDLNSLNGTYINNELLKKPVVLSEGDKIIIGGVTFKFERCAYEVE